MVDPPSKTLVLNEMPDFPPESLPNVFLAAKILQEHLLDIAAINGCFVKSQQTGLGVDMLLGQALLKNHQISMQEFIKLRQSSQDYALPRLKAQLREQGYVVNYQNGLVVFSQTRPQTPAPEPKKQIGRYQILRELGRGGMGVVYAGYEPTLERTVALKILRGDNKTLLQRFFREARLIAALSHPNIVKVYEVGEDAGQKLHYIVMDYVDGRNLGTMVPGKRFWPKRAFELLLPISKALAYSHAQGIIHRDVKPSNIMISKNEGREVPYLMDFGLARAIKEKGLTRSGQILGTPRYMSPEQAKGQRNIDARSDIYSLGVILYEMLTGKPLIKSGQVMQILSRVVHDDPPLLSSQVVGIDKDAEAITMKCLEKDPHRRYQNGAALSADMERYLKRETVHARRPSYWYRLWRRLCRHGKVTTLAALVVLLGGILIALLLNQESDQAALQIADLTQEAATLLQKGDLKGAGNLYLSILKLDPHNLAAYQGVNQTVARLTRQCLQRPNTTNVRELYGLYQAVRTRYPRHPGVLAGRQRIGQLIAQIWEKIKQAAQAKEFDRALAGCRRILAWPSQWMPAGQNVSAYILHLTRLKETCRKNARKFYDRALEIFWNPGLDEKMLKHCLEQFQRAIAIDPTFADAYFQAGRASQRLFQNDAAIHYYERSLQYDPSLTAPKYYLTMLKLPLVKSRANLRQHLYALDGVFTKIWGTAQQEDKDPYRLLAQSQLWWHKLNVLRAQRNHHSRKYQKWWQNCQRYCNWLIEQHPTFADTYLIRAQLNSYLMQPRRNAAPYIQITRVPKNLNQALSDCFHLIYLNPHCFEAYYLRAAIYHSIGAYHLAIDDYTHALLLKQTHSPRLYQNRAVCYLAMQQFNMCLADLDTSIAFFHERELSPEGQELLGDAYLMRAFIKCLRQDRSALEDLKAYLARRGKHVAYADGLLKAIVYLFCKQKLAPTERAFRQFLTYRDNHKVLKLLAQGIPMVTPQDLQIVLQYAPNLFCCVPAKSKLKIRFLQQFFRRYRGMLRLFKTEILKKFTLRTDFDLCTLSRFTLKQFNDARIGPKLRALTRTFQGQSPPLEILISLVDYFNDQTRVQRLLTLKQLPAASLYYRRAVEHYTRGRLQLAARDLQEAVQLDPNYMPAHYGLATVNALILNRKKQQNGRAQERSRYRQAALYHLRRAVLLGWPHLMSETLNDPEFAALGLGRQVSRTQLQTWETQRHAREQAIRQFGQEIALLRSRGEDILALQRLYRSEFAPYFTDLINATEKAVLSQLARALRDTPEPVLERKIKRLLGEHGRMQWEWLKRQGQSEKQQ